MHRRQFLLLALPAIVGLLLMPASAQLVEQPVRIIYPFAAGGSNMSCTLRKRSVNVL